MSRDQFARHVEWLGSGRVRVVPLNELRASDEHDDAIALTFDDGLTNFGEIAAPMLAEHSLPVTVFISPAHVGSYNSWDNANRASIPRLPILSWSEIRNLSAAGVDFGGHGDTHIPLAGLDGQRLDGEVASCSRAISRELGKKPKSFAYPYGSFDENTVRVVSRYFDTACTTELRATSPDDSPMKLPRLDMYYFKDVSIGDIWGTVAFGPYVRLRAAGRAIRALGKRN